MQVEGDEALELRKRLEETNKAMWALYKELDDKNAELARSNAELDQFALIASHDLQEPLRKVLAFGDRLREEYGHSLDRRGQDYVARMQDASRRMLLLIEDLLGYARVTSRAQPFQATDLNRVADEVVADLEDRILRSGGLIELGTLPVIDAEPSQMRQLFQNLISNGLKFYARDRPPIIRITSRPLGADAWQITFADNGIGFDAKYAERILQPFRRLHGKHAYEGTGMGLAICEKIIRRHNGRLKAAGIPDAGATFTVTLPARQPYAAPDPLGDPVGI